MADNHKTEVADLKVHLATLKKDANSKTEALIKDNLHLTEVVKQLKEFGEGKERELVHASDALCELRGKTEVWLDELGRIRAAFASKSFASRVTFRLSYFLL